MSAIEPVGEPSVSMMSGFCAIRRSSAGPKSRAPRS
jgi:hypothetical protein